MIYLPHNQNRRNLQKKRDFDGFEFLASKDKQKL